MDHAVKINLKSRFDFNLILGKKNKTNIKIKTKTKREYETG
jgi:hypothetical protein